MQNLGRNSGMGKMQRDKGARIERGEVKRFREAGIYAERVPLSGASKGRRMGNGHDIDVYIGPDSAPLCGEIKGRKEIPKYIKEWLGENDFLLIKEDRSLPIVMVPWRTFRDLLKGYRNA